MKSADLQKGKDDKYLEEIDEGLRSVPGKKREDSINWLKRVDKKKLREIFGRDKTGVETRVENILKEFKITVDENGKIKKEDEELFGLLIEFSNLIKDNKTSQN